MRVRTGRVAVNIGNQLAATGAAPWVDMEACYGRFSLQTIVTGAPTAVSITLEGSNDGVTPFGVALITSTSTTGDTQYAVDKMCQFIRVNLGTLTLGTAPKVTAFVAVGP